MSVSVGIMSPELVTAIQDFIRQQTGKNITVSNLDYSYFNNRLHFLVDGASNYRINFVKGTISRPSEVGYSRVPRINDIESGSEKLAVIKSLVLDCI